MVESGPRPVIFLDRDGTINVDSEQGYVSSPDQVQLAPQAAAGLALLQQAGYVLAIITNQSGIARNYYTTADMRAVHDRLQELLAAEGVTIDAIAFCPHDRDSLCECRKPQPEMAKHIEEQVGAINYAQSWTIGDKLADMGFGNNIGSNTALIRSPHWTEEEITHEPTLIVDSLFDAAQQIVNLKTI